MANRFDYLRSPMMLPWYGVALVALFMEVRDVMREPPSIPEVAKPIVRPAEAVPKPKPTKAELQMELFEAEKKLAEVDAFYAPEISRANYLDAAMSVRRKDFTDAQRKDSIAYLAHLEREKNERRDPYVKRIAQLKVDVLLTPDP